MLRVCLQSKWFWIPIWSLPLKLQISQLFWARSSITFRQYRVQIHSKLCTWHDNNIQSLTNIVTNLKPLTSENKPFFSLYLISGPVYFSCSSGLNKIQTFKVQSITLISMRSFRYFSIFFVQKVLRIYSPLYNGLLEYLSPPTTWETLLACVIILNNLWEILDVL